MVWPVLRAVSRYAERTGEEVQTDGTWRLLLLIAGGMWVFLLLFLLLFLVGGGIAQVVLFLPAWAEAMRINQPLVGWRKILPESVRRVLARIWPVALVVGAVSLELKLWLYRKYNLCYSYI